MRPDALTRPVLVVSGLSAEARIAAGPGVTCVAAPPSALADKLAALTVEPSAVVSFGLCGGLAPTLRLGTLVVGTEVRYGRETWHGDLSLAARLRQAAGSEVAEGRFACADTPILTRRAKAEFHNETGAVAVDTESHIAAAYAAERGLPFAVLRAVSDPAGADLPPLAVRAIGPDGRLNWRAIGGEIATRPGQLLALPGTALGTLKAMRALRRVRRRLGPGFGL